MILETIYKWAKESVVDEILIFALLIAIFESIAQNTIKSSKNNESLQFLFGILVYIFVGYLLHFAYKVFPLSKMNLVWSCLSIIFGIVMGYLLFDEKINFYSILSIILAISAVIVSSFI